MAANIPVVMSAIATPTLSGGPSGSPVIDIPPASAWMAKSKPGRCASTLSGGVPGDRGVDEAAAASPASAA